MVELIQNVGALVRFLPPYSSDLNAIEEAFSKVKSIVRAHDELSNACLDTEPVVGTAFASITTDDCLGWAPDCGYL